MARNQGALTSGGDAEVLRLSPNVPIVLVPEVLRLPLRRILRPRPLVHVAAVIGVGDVLCRGRMLCAAENPGRIWRHGTTPSEDDTGVEGGNGVVVVDVLLGENGCLLVFF